MKRYVKPDLFYENFELSHNVASCSVSGNDTKLQSNAQDGDSCQFEYEDLLLFNAGGCSASPDVLEAYCYQTGAFDLNFFAS